MLRSLRCCSPQKRTRFGLCKVWRPSATRRIQILYDYFRCSFLANHGL